MTPKEQARIRAKRYRERHPERARAARRKTDAARRSKPGYSQEKKDREEQAAKIKAQRLDLIRQRLLTLKQKTNDEMGSMQQSPE